MWTIYLHEISLVFSYFCLVSRLGLIAPGVGMVPGGMGIMIPGPMNHMLPMMPPRFRWSPQGPLCLAPVMHLPMPIIYPWTSNTTKYEHINRNTILEIRHWKSKFFVLLLSIYNVRLSIFVFIFLSYFSWTIRESWELLHLKNLLILTISWANTKKEKKVNGTQIVRSG